MDYTKASSLDILLASVRNEKIKFTRLEPVKVKARDCHYTRFSKSAKGTRGVKVS
jgi:hypothetical protein